MSDERPTRMPYPLKGGYRGGRLPAVLPPPPTTPGPVSEGTPGEAKTENDAPCMQKNRDCWGEVAAYSFDLDLPNVTLCRGHVWELMKPKTRYEKYAVAEALDEETPNE